MFVSIVNQVEFPFSKRNITAENDKASNVSATLDTTLPWSTCKLHRVLNNCKVSRYNPTKS